MKQFIKKLIMSGLVAGALTGAVSQVSAQTTVSVDPAKTWIGYMNVFGLNPDGSPNYGAYQFGSVWGTKDLRGYFDPAGKVALTLTACTNVWNPTNSYWVNVDGTPNKWMDASYYVQNDNLAGQTITFNGTCLTNTLAGQANSTAFIKVFQPDYSSSYNTTAPLVSGGSFSLQLTANPGTHVQYGFETQGPDVSPTNLLASGLVTIAIGLPDPSLSEVPNQTVVEGQTVTLSSIATGTAPFTYQWDVNGNDLSDGNGITGSTSNKLTISAVTLDQAGTYTLTVNNSVGQNAAVAQLNVLPLAQVLTNLLVNPGFESGAWLPGWSSFNGAAVVSTSDNYYNSSTPIDVLDGMYEAQVYPTGAGSYNGFYQDLPATPGTVYTASANFYTSSLDQISGGNDCYLEVQFRDTYGNVLVDYQSAKITASSPTDTWINLAPTNVLAGDFNTSLGTSSVLVAPAGTAAVRAQITYYAPATDGGSVYVDNLDLRLRAPAVTASYAGSKFKLSFPTIYGPTYRVSYKNNLSDAAWLTLTNVLGDGTVKTVTDTAGGKSRFYVVNTQ